MIKPQAMTFLALIMDHSEHGFIGQMPARGVRPLSRRLDTCPAGNIPSLVLTQLDSACLNSTRLVLTRLNSSWLVLTQLNSTQLVLTFLDSSQLDSTWLVSNQLVSTQLNSTQLDSICLDLTQLVSSLLYSSWLDSTCLDSTRLVWDHLFEFVISRSLFTFRLDLVENFIYNFTRRDADTSYRLKKDLMSSLKKN